MGGSLSLEDFERHLKNRLRRSPRTVATYLDVVRRLLGTTGGELPDREALQTYLRDLSQGTAPASQALHVSALRHYFGWRATAGDTAAAALRTSLLRPRVPKKLVRTLDEDDIALLLKTIAARPPAERLLFELLYGSGLRISEALTLKRTDVAPAEGVAYVRGKGEKTRKVPLTPGALKLFETETFGDPLWGDVRDVRALRRWVETWGQLTALPVDRLHPHLLRHSIATHLIRRGAGLAQVQKFLGHTKLSTTERYTHLSIDDLVKAYDTAFPLKKTPKL